MSKGKLSKRLVTLFSQIDPVDPRPGLGDDLPIQEPSSLYPTLQPQVEASQLEDLERNGEENPPANPPLRAPTSSGWDDFLDGIHRNENIEVEYGTQKDASTEEPGRKVEELTSRIQVGDSEIGSIQLERGPDQQWTQDDVELVNSVVQQLVQQMETLRLLDEAQRSRTEAEEAFHRLTRHSDAVEAIALDSSSLPALLESEQGFVFDAGKPVKPIAEVPPDALPGGVLNTPIRMGGDVIGSLLVDHEEALSQDEMGLVETVAQRLEQQMENLRLLEESRHFRTEAEDAIRRLTYQSWNTYLQGTDKKRLAFLYDRNQVLPLAPDSRMKGKIFPLKVREEVIGKLALKAPGAESKETVELVNVISDRLSTHLDGLRLAEQREQALSETETLYSISARLSTAQTLEDALTSVSQPAHTAGATDSRLFFVSYDETGQIEGLTLAAIWYPDEGSQLIPVQAHFLLSDYPAYRMSLSDPDNPLLIEDVEADERLDKASRDMFLRTGAKAVAVLPLTINMRWVGAIFINWDAPHGFSAQERRLYTTLARQAAVVINNRLLLEQTRKRAQELQTVAQVSTAASTILDPQELLFSVVDLTKSSFSLYHAQVYLYRPMERILEAAAGSGEIGRIIAAQKLYEVWEALSPVARAARDRQVVIINDVSADPAFKGNAFLPNIRSEMVVPMVVGDRLLGVFDVLSDQTGRFSREDARTYSTLATQVAVALQNAELYAEQTATVERLRELDHLKSSFLANMSHELRTPLNSILGFGEVLLLELDGPLTDLMVNDIKLIEKNGKHLLSLINDVLDMAKIEAGRMNMSYERFVLRELLNDTIDITGSLAREKGLYLQVAPDSQDQIEISADRVRIRQVMINVISNAVKFTEKGGIMIRSSREDDKIVIQVKDTGLGVPKDKLEMIFEEFSQVDTSTTRKVGGTGLGLPISRRLVEMHGGRMWAESTGIAGSGTLIVIELPIEAVKPT
jgi:signal transduction histidine kinase